MTTSTIRNETVVEKVHRSEKNAVLFTKYNLRKLGWRSLDFQSKKGRARTGIVDLIAVKLDRKDADILKMILFQVKGGSARITEDEKKRLETSVKKVEVTFNWTEKPMKSITFGWKPSDENFDSHLTR